MFAGQLGPEFVFDLLHKHTHKKSAAQVLLLGFPGLGGRQRKERRGGGGRYSNLEIDQLLRKRAHLIIEAKPILPGLRGREDKIPLPLFLVVHDDFLVRAHDAVIDVEGAARLDLWGESRCQYL